MSQRYERLKTLLKELFQLDKPDLDFGIYRVLHAKSAEVTQFLEKDLLPQVKAAFAQYQSADKTAIEKELAKASEQAKTLGADPETLPKIKELRARLADDAVDLDALEAEVYDHLYGFFRRYYSEGDFLSKRVYKPGVYAIPYEGEEVKLHWANADQYYIKTSEYLRDYAFRLRPDDEKNPMRVHFRLVDATEGEHDNVKETEGRERRFKLAAESLVVVEDGELVVRFTYEPDSAKQKELNAAAEQVILSLGNAALAEWLREMERKHVRSDGTLANATRLRAHLDRYTGRNTFDYFIHKDLGSFLRRELDFYIKNEVMHLDDVESETAQRVEQYLSKIKVIRSIAGKIIDFLAQLEDLQKKLWLKKKFVVETQYCMTLDRVPEDFYPEIAANAGQRDEWVRLFAIDKVRGDLTTPDYSEPLTPTFLKAHPTLVVDTRHFDPNMRDRLISAVDSIDQKVTGYLVHSDNFQALRLLSATLARRFRFFYIDPPYNTESDDFLYKDNYRYSSWISLIEDRVLLAHALLDDDGSIAVSIDQNSLGLLRLILDRVFGRDNLISTVTVKRATVSGPKVINPGVVNVSDYVLLYAKDRRTWVGNTVYAERGRDSRYTLFVCHREKDPSKWEFRSLLDVFAEEIGIEKGRLKSELRDEYEERIHEFVKKNASSVAQPALVRPNEVSAEYRAKLAESAAAPERVVYYRRPGFSDAYLLKGKVLLFYSDKVKKIGQRLVTAERASDIWTDVLPNDVHNEGGVAFGSGKKPEALIARLMDLCSETNDLVGDFFLGSGTFASVAQKTGRRWVGIESAGFFSDVTLRRLRNVLKGDTRGISDAVNWRGGGIVRYSELESYEDTLNNLELRRTEEQQRLLDLAQAQGPEKLREQYILRYMLDVETRGSQSLLNIAAFTDPTAYRLKVKRPGSDESREVAVDLLETFNWLIGLTVQHIAAPQTLSATFKRDDDPDLREDAPRRLLLEGRLKEDPDGRWWFRSVTGTTPDGRRALVIWRKRPGGETPDGIEQDNLVLDEWVKKQGYSSKDSEFDLIYVNGDNNLENLKASDDTWKVRLIEEDFHRLMFETDGI